MTSTQAGSRPSGRNAPSSSWSTCGRCRRSWPGCTSAWTCVGRRRKRRKKRTGSLRGCPKSRRRPRLTATWTSCLAIWKILVILYRSCTWPRTRSLRSRRLCRCRTYAQTVFASNCDFLLSPLRILWPPRCYGEGGIHGIKRNESKRLRVLPPHRVFLGGADPPSPAQHTLVREVRPREGAEARPVHPGPEGRLPWRRGAGPAPPALGAD